MGKQQWIIAIVIVVVLVLAGYYGYKAYEKHKNGPPKGEGMQNLYNQQPAAPAPPCTGYPPQKCPSNYPRSTERFAGGDGDADNWPEAGTFGALSDTYPYGNYAGGVEMWYPTYNEGASRSYPWTYA